MTSIFRKTGPAAPRIHRFAGLDLARGLAVIAMVLYHLSWDLGYFHISPVELAGSPLGHLSAHVIATVFLGLVGISLVLAGKAPQFEARFRRRLALIGASAAAISLITYVMMPESWIFFGILHCIFISSLIGYMLLNASVPLLIVLSFSAALLPVLVSTAQLDPLPLVWLGLSENLPATNDFAPLFPGLGAVLAGMVLAKLKWPNTDIAFSFANDNTPLRSAPPLKRGLLWCGRHSLAIYLIHQPVLFGAFMLAYPVEPVNAHFETECQSQCVSLGTAQNICIPACDCMKQRLQSSGLWTKMLRGTMNADDQTHLSEMALVCGESARDAATE